MASSDYPAMTTKPRYLTGDRVGLKEFLDKFDVRHDPGDLSCYALFCQVLETGLDFIIYLINANTILYGV